MFKKIMIGLSHDDELKARLVINIQGVIIYLIAMVIFVFTMFMIVKPIPIVYHSVSKDKCIAVYIDGVKYDCSNMPLTYERVYVE